MSNNGFSAADMSTAAANGFRDGLAAQPATAQETVAWRDDAGNLYPDKESVDKYLPRGRTVHALYAAPVAAAPVGDDGRPMVLVSQEFKAQAEYDAKISSDASNLLRDNALGLTGSLPAMVGELLNLASTPAAPGIDHAQFKDLIGFAAWNAINLPETDPRRDFIRQASELLALTDASPKGGSEPTGVLDALVSLVAVARRYLPDYDEHPEVQKADAAIDAAMQAQAAAPGIDVPAPRNREEAMALAKLALAHLGVIEAHIDAAIARCVTDASPKGVTLRNDGSSEAQFIADSESLDCPACGGSGHVDDSPKGGGFPWENFPAYLIDKCEGDTISEEGLQRAVADMAKDPRYALQATSAEVGL